MVLISDIPRFYTGLAQWAGCFIVLLICRRKVNYAVFTVISMFAAVIQCGFLVLTARVDAGALWIFFFMLALFFMFLYIYLCADIPLKGVVYCTAAAFLHAELAASLEWQLHSWASVKAPLSMTASILLLIAVYMAVFTAFFFVFKPHMTENYLDSLTRREVISVLLIALLTFVFSNQSFFLTGSPFSSRVPEDIYAIRTLVDAIGIVALLGFQNRISELLAQKELNSIRHVLHSQYEQFRNYQESEEMLHMMQHDLKHQINGLRGETNEQKREAWLDMMENELDKWWLPQRTGNPVFDTLLSAALRKARQLDVRITCVADGALLNKMHVADICTVFGNALDNAMESVVMIPEPEKRLIHVSVSAQKSFIFINISNTLGTELIESPDGLLTTKIDKKEHGYGLKGIRYVVGKYDGNMTYKAEDGWFRLNILIPM